MTIRSILLFLFILTVISSFAQKENINTSPNTMENTDIEIVLDSIEQEDTTIELFPADDLYKNLWNCTNIKYPKTDFARKNDTILFTLVEPNDYPFVQPFKGRILSKFGPRHGRIHTGTDIKLHLGDSVFCAFDGKVRLAQKFSGYGNLVLVRHKNGIETIYAHLKTIKVKVNEPIKAGDLIGFGGRTGRATTEHLHFETRIFGDPFDSNKYIDFENFTLRTNQIYYKNKQIYIDIDKIKGDKTVPPSVLASKSDSLNINKNKSKASVSSDIDDGNFIQHVIRSGDNLWSIAKKYNTTVKNICEINKISVNHILKIGTLIYIR